MSDWTELCRVMAPGVELGFLSAFDRGDTDVGLAHPAGLVALCHREANGLEFRIRSVLRGEVDAHQAGLFARRFRSVHDLLLGLDGPVARALWVALVRRTVEVLADMAPRALRVRAVADFFYSQGARLVHRGSEVPFAARVAGVVFRDVARGVRHALLQGPGPMGPLHVNLLEVRGRRLSTLDCRPGRDLVERVRSAGAVAGVSGGFFLYSEPDIALPSVRTDPVGLLVCDSVVVNPPVFARASLTQDISGAVGIERIGLLGCEVSPGGIITRVNTQGAGIGAWTRSAVQISPEVGWMVVGSRVIGRGREVPVNGFVLVGVELEEGKLLSYRIPGDPLEAIAGGPMLLHPIEPICDLRQEDFSGTAPPVTFSNDETYDQNLLPRLAVGSRPDGSTVFAAIDGRDLARAPGLTLAGTADLMRALGCTVAMNLDGGSSKRMVVEGRVVDRPSTDVLATGSAPSEVRPVNTAILIGARLGTVAS